MLDIFDAIYSGEIKNLPLRLGGAACFDMTYRRFSKMISHLVPPADWLVAFTCRNKCAAPPNLWVKFLQLLYYNIHGNFLHFENLHRFNIVTQDSGFYKA